MQGNRVILAMIFAAAAAGAAHAQAATDTAPTATAAPTDVAASAQDAHPVIVHAALGDIPEAARRAHQEGEATLDCVVAEDGGLGCALVEETPHGWGFGDAAVQLTQKFRVAARTTDGRTTGGGHLSLSILFSPDHATNQRH